MPSTTVDSWTLQLARLGARVEAPLHDGLIINSVSEVDNGHVSSDLLSASDLG